MPAARPGRLPALDRLRAVALLLMLVHHLTEWLSGAARQILPGWRTFAVTDVAAPAFAIAAGASLQLLVASRRQRGQPAMRVHALVLRRYGLLVPIGMVLGWLVFDGPLSFGVLECLGVATVAAYAVAAVLPPAGVAAAAVAALALDPAVERAAGGAGGLVENALAGTFPVTVYAGFALCGVLAARVLGTRDRWREAAIAGLAGGAVVVAAAVAGHVPTRYPAGPLFVVAGLSATALLFALLSRWPRRDGAADRVLRAAGTHTFGIFLAHHLVYVAVDRTGRLGSWPAGPALAAAVATALAIVLLAPVVPPLPWTPRRGWAAGRSLTAWRSARSAPPASRSASSVSGR